MLLRVTASAFNERGALYMEQALAAIHEGAGTRQRVTWALARVGAHVALLCDVPAALRELVAGQLLAHYPAARVSTFADTTVPAGHGTWTLDLSLTPEALPLRRYVEYADGGGASADPLTGILAALAAPERDPLSTSIEIVARPADRGRIRRARRAVSQLTRPRFAAHPEWGRTFLAWALSPRLWQRMLARALMHLAGAHRPTAPPHATSRTHDRETDRDAAIDKLDRRLFLVGLRLVATGPLSEEARARRKLFELVGALGQLTSPHLAELRTGAVRRRRGCRLRECLLSTEELATLWHLPTFSVQPPAVDTSDYRQLEPPPVLPDPRREPATAMLGRTAFRDRSDRVGIRGDDRRRHLYIVGKTGMGKSTLLLKLLCEDITAGRGCALIDPHGDLTELVLAAVPARRTNDVVLFDAGDRTHPIAFNPLAGCSPADRSLTASGVLAAFKKLFGGSWGPRMEHIFRNCLLALLETPGSSLVSVVELLGNPRFRHAIVGRVTDPVVRAFWLQEFAGMPARLQAEAIAPVQNKVGHFVSNPIVRQIIGAPRSTIDVRSIMDARQVLLVNLSKGRIGEDSSNLLGALLISSLQLAAMRRAELPETERRDFFLCVDEFQNFATESFATILSEARKYRLCLTLANQYLAQMDEATSAAVFGNVGSLLTFQVGADDAEALAAQLAGKVTPQDLIALPRYEAYLRMLIDGVPSRPFSLRTTAPDFRSFEPRRGEIIRRASRRRYGRSPPSVVAEIEQRFAAK